MAKKADILEPRCECTTRGTQDCICCPEYDTCDICQRRVCKYVAVNTYQNGEFDYLICRPCARNLGWNENEIATQAIDLVLLLSGDALHKEIDKRKNG